MTLLFMYLALAIGVSFLCSIVESVLLSLNMSHINVIKQDKEKVGNLLEKLKTDIDVSIASILILNTIAHTLGAAGIGAEAARLFGMEYMFYISAILTLLILFLSEIIPKTIGAQYYKELAPIAAYIIRVFIFFSYPLIKVSLFITEKISKKGSNNSITREELLQTALLVEDGGYIDEKESDVIENVLSLSKSKVNDILTPRSVVFALEKNTKIEDVLKTEGAMKFSRIPVYDKTIDNIIGVVYSKQIFKLAIEDKSGTIESLISPIFSIHENIPVSYTLDMFIKRKEHMFLVTDSYGQTEGIVTLEDCIETLLGLEIMDELDTTEDMRKLAKDKMKKRKKIKSI
ncbi:CNNM domain-containing protein [Sulfurospirillum arcachonense]|uniref:CNNM domain-containing protein n=1 Tax=Sulfurospirillum arcachonense TaxID=57666 RepID=UPI000468CF50|nr:CNNM domain-containing protein [Sulfurospirillum arcachonense]